MSQELNWFEFETRMRTLIIDLIQPTIKRISANEETLLAVENKVLLSSKKIKEIEALLGFGDEKSGWMEEIEKIYRGFSIKLSDLEAEHTSKMKHFELINEKSSSEIHSIQRKIEGIVVRGSEVENQIQSLRSSLSAQAQSVNSFLETNKQEFSEKYNVIVTETCNFKQRAESIGNRISEIFNKFNDTQVTFEKFRLGINELKANLQKVSNEKVNYDELTQSFSGFNEKVSILSENLKIEADKTREILRYLNIYLPKEIQTNISDSIYASTDKKSLTAFNKYEQQLIHAFENEVSIGETSDTGEIIKRAIGANMRMVKRCKDFIYAGQVKMIDKPLPGHMRHTSADFHLNSPNSPDRFNNKINPTELDIQINNRLSSFTEMLKKTREESTSNYEKSEIFLEILRKEYEDIKAKLSSDRKIFDRELLSFSNATSKFETSFNSISEKVKDLAYFSKELVECLLIIYHLMSQDEDDRKLSCIGSKDKAVEKKILTLENEKIHFQGNHASHYCKLYNPTPLLYKDVLYQRGELVEVMGAIVKAAWVKANLPEESKKKKSSDFVVKKHSSHKLNASFTSRKKF